MWLEPSGDGMPMESLLLSLCFPILSPPSFFSITRFLFCQHRSLCMLTVTLSSQNAFIRVYLMPTNSQQAGGPCKIITHADYHSNSRIPVPRDWDLWRSLNEPLPPHLHVLHVPLCGHGVFMSVYMCVCAHMCMYVVCVRVGGWQSRNTLGVSSQEPFMQ